jgi:starvation-inducible DNA-binding protein
MTVEEMMRVELARNDRAAADLQDTLVELLELAAQAKQAHWNVVGPMFKPVHLELDEIAEMAWATSDDVAERIAARRAFPDGRTLAVAQAQPFAELPAGVINAEEAVRLFVARLEDLTGRLTQRIARLGEVDLVSQDMLIGIAQRFEKELWMLRAHRG